ncbi:manganese and iron superoxide dismutase [Leucosporidium creatinivorum]|uniref:Superoxide dismutase n=1 Tax=Leucosporidium creatinivorum TaxID=106004 RepID=A0A1Y2EPZ2_9BASI|nr:manganese and iron superoxide dismutase [Leucosporidium creatinivorum]
MRFTLRPLALIGLATLATQAHAQYTLPPLPYAYDALEPVISKEIMTLHHDRHHATYVRNLNAATAELAQVFAHQGSLMDLEREIALQSAIKFNGGGHINHSLFWESLTPVSNSSFPTSGPLKKAVDSQFGSLDALKSTMTTNALGIQGSGWSWLIYHPSNKTMEVVSTADQDPVLGATPLLGIDIWEHAYYLDYLNDKASYLQHIWSGELHLLLYPLSLSAYRDVS